MARIIGTNRSDELWAGSGGDVVRGRGGSDTIEGGAGADRIYGDRGNDDINAFYWTNEGVLLGAADLLYGGAGDDELSGGRECWGGVGNDRVGAGPGGLSVGGKGDDILGGSDGDLYGDEGPGRAQRVAGNDALGAGLDDGGYVRMTGGRGADYFGASAVLDGQYGAAEVMDFTPGQDKLNVTLWRGTYEGEDTDLRLFNELDANDNGVLEWSDSLSGGRVWVDDATNTMFLGCGDDALIVHGTTQLAAGSDWIMG